MQIRILKRVRGKSADESGFSMPELLVVMLIMGIMAAVVTPGFGCHGQAARATDQESKVIARSAASTMEAYANDNLGAYDGATGSTLHAMDSAVPSNTTVTAYANCSGPNGTCYVVKSPPNPQTSITYQLTKTSDGKLLSSCSSTGAGGCPSDGKWSAE
jgi:prepilin-type N-terminal cleavage/methylation domain-containing protein